MAVMKEVIDFFSSFNYICLNEDAKVTTCCHLEVSSKHQVEVTALRAW